jgi:hypothetical protein
MATGHGSAPSVFETVDVYFEKGAELCDYPRGLLDHVISLTTSMPPWLPAGRDASKSPQNSTDGAGTPLARQGYS